MKKPYITEQLFALGKALLSGEITHAQFLAEEERLESYIGHQPWLPFKEVMPLNAKPLTKKGDKKWRK